MKKSILSIAGSDSIAGAGIQIDIKVAASLGVHATCAVTAVTAQSTMSVDAVQTVDPDVVCAQIRAAFSDVPPAAVKVGMIGNGETAEAVAGELALHPKVPVVLDPVLVATSGGSLYGDSVLDALIAKMIPSSTIVTPNVPEARALTGIDVSGPEGMREAAGRIAGFGAGYVLVKGGHGSGSECVDRLYGSEPAAAGDSGPSGDATSLRELLELRSPRLRGEFHGSGCSLSTAIACGLAQGMPVEDAVTRAHGLVSRMLARPTGLGHGSQIVDPFSA